MTAGIVLPRDWDAGRLLRFLAGLALLALGFAASAGLIATPAHPTPVAPATVVTTVDLPAAADATAAEATEAPDAGQAPAGLPPIAVPVIEIRFSVIEPWLAADPAGDTQDSPGPRAPPVV